MKKDSICDRIMDDEYPGGKLSDEEFQRATGEFFDDFSREEREEMLKRLIASRLVLQKARDTARRQLRDRAEAFCLECRELKPCTPEFWSENGLKANRCRECESVRIPEREVRRPGPLGYLL